MWYWVCSCHPDTCLAFTVRYCVSSRMKAGLLLAKLRLKEPDGRFEIKERPEHNDSDYKQYRCPECGNEMSRRELSAAWDWAGPHCNECGCTGMTMFASVMEKTPVVAAKREGLRGVFSRILE